MKVPAQMDSTDTRILDRVGTDFASMLFAGPGRVTFPMMGTRSARGKPEIQLPTIFFTSQCPST